ncbi:arginine:ornithine antiporter/lysine permease [Pullulanibacillus pueri]|uniref:Arginine:ornithine antiporter n=1 Tax=Pullulanibacillus pueri TaxID=1437324 RepID=A0A8J2ZWC9_9BACL|nr:amino acid permease [Pullulanibacillus pueri]MBM7680885.1 arginine:ornithine antiporter/lysine permease [Pullulanibacillus pueri]GGH81206.1 arginine:ornithine antiporter [Pullulanibacillus pueri]
MSSKAKLSVWVLTALVVGNMVGSGIFMLPSNLAQVARPGGVLLAWIFTGVGVLFIALIFGNLAVKRPEMTGGPQIYAKGLFSQGSRLSSLAGYFVSWGYWVANFAGNVAVITSFAGYLSTFFPVLNSSSIVLSIGHFNLTVGHLLTFIICSVLLWGLHFLILRGIEGAGKVNLIATAAKLIGFLLFIIATLFIFQSSNLVPFASPKVVDGQSIGLLGQLNHAAVATLWAFVGVESAVVFSSRAKKVQDVKKATIFGLLIATGVYIAITLLVMGSLNQSALSHSSKPLVDALTVAIGSGGGYLLAGLAVVCLFGSTIGWILLSAEVPYQSAKQGLFLKVFGHENKKGTPTKSLVITNIATQILIFSTISSSIADAFNFVTTIATLSYLLPYLVSALFQVKLSFTDSLQKKTPVYSQFIIGFLGTAYALYVVVAGTSDMETFLWGIFFVGVGIVFYPFILFQERQNKVMLSSKNK